MKKYFLAVLAVTIMFCIAGCSKNNLEKLVFKQQITSNELALTVETCYVSSPIIDSDITSESIIFRLSIENLTNEFVNIENSDYFTFTINSGEKCEFSEIAFQPIKGYVNKKEIKKGQIGFKIPNDYNGVGLFNIILGNKTYSINVDFNSTLIKSKCPDNEYSLNDSIKIDQLIVTPKKVEILTDNLPIEAKLEKDYLKIDLNIVSVSAGAPSDIKDEHFKLSFGNIKIKCFKRSLPDSLASNDKIDGNVIFEVDKGIELSKYSLILTRHIKGEDIVLCKLV